MRYRNLQTVESVPAAHLCVRRPHEFPTLSKTDSVDRIMVGFCRECAMTIEPHQHLDATLKQTQSVGIRALLVVADGRVSGLITVYDIQSEKPIQFVRSSDYIHHPQCRHKDVEVADINATISPMRASRDTSS